MNEQLIVCGLLVHAIPGKAPGLVDDLGTMPGTEVHHETDDGRLVVTVESGNQRQVGDILIQIQSLPGVASASLVYHHFEQIEGQGLGSDPTQAQTTTVSGDET